MSVVLRELISGLRAHPAYLLLFGIVVVFVLGSGAGAIVGFRADNTAVGAVWLLAFFAALATAYFVIRKVDEAPRVDAGLSGPDTSDHAGTLPQVRFSATFPPNLEREIRESNTITLIGVHQSHIVIGFYDLVLAKAAVGSTINVLLLDPSSSAVSLTAMRFPGADRVEQERARILASIRSYWEAKRRYPSRVNVRLTSFLLAYGGYALDLGTPAARIFLQQYTFRTHGGPRKPKFSLRAGDGGWFDFYAAEIGELWKAGLEVDTAVMARLNLPAAD